MGQRKAIVACPHEYPMRTPARYYVLVFKKTAQERDKLRELRLEHKAQIGAEYGNVYNRRQLKKINNPTQLRLID